jgi:hypothetical protein
MQTESRNLANQITEAAPRVAEEHDLFRKAIDDLNEHEAGLLRAVLEHLRPALGALGGRIKGRNWKGLHLGAGCYLVTEGGELARAGKFWQVVDGSAIPILAEQAIEAVGLGNILEAINRALQQQLQGAKRRRTKEARQRARLLQAVLTLVEGYEPSFGLTNERAAYQQAARVISDACGQMEALEPRRRLWVLNFLVNRSAGLLRNVADELEDVELAMENYLNGKAAIGTAVKALNRVTEWRPDCAMAFPDSLACLIFQLEKSEATEPTDPSAVEALRIGAERFIEHTDNIEDMERRVVVLAEMLTAAIQFARESVTREQVAAPLMGSNGRKATNRKVAA